MPATLILISIVLSFWIGIDRTLAEPPNIRNIPKIWDIAFGTPVSTLPADEFVNPACGTNGGPPGQSLGNFANFRRCQVETSTGFREVWFARDDELEYIYRARRQPLGVSINAANVLLGQPVIFSFLIDDAGLIQGYRVASDSRADPSVRIDADQLSDIYKARFGDDGWRCMDLPRLEGERPLEGLYVKQSCEKLADDRHILVETHRYFKPGQDPLVRAQFESSARLEVYMLVSLPR